MWLVAYSDCFFPSKFEDIKEWSNMSSISIVIEEYNEMLIVRNGVMRYAA